MGVEYRPLVVPGSTEMTDSLYCGHCGHIRQHHLSDGAGTRCEQCLATNPVNTDFYHAWAEFNKFGNRVWGEVV